MSSATGPVKICNQPKVVNIIKPLKQQKECKKEAADKLLKKKNKSHPRKSKSNTDLRSNKS
ncbi:unnamed protein product [Brassica napus]|uniref:(rape) hypothetical protein n=1 Tax=Brassica napus TaxID=3708 RepID=A0A816XVV0_BRANA|nr:unnamed protein product [Brassica napus]